MSSLTETVICQVCLSLCLCDRDVLLSGVRPSVKMDKERQTVSQGSTATIRCEVTGSPTPAITWSKSRGELGPNHQVMITFDPAFS